MAIHDLFDKNLLIYRLKSAGGRKTAFQSTATVQGALQNQVREMVSNLGIMTSRNWVAYVDISEDIKPGDQVRYRQYTFLVDEVTPHDYGVNQHKELLLKEANE